MKRFYGFYTILFTMMILIITTSAGAFFAGDRKGVFGGDREPSIKANDPLVKASTTLRDREAVPEGLTKTEWGKIRATIERDQYRFHTGKHKNMYQATNHAQGMSFTFTSEGLEVRLKKQKGARTWGLRLKRYGYGTNLHDASAVEDFVVQDNRIEYHRRELIEWYINDHRGLEQGFTLQQKPAGSKDAAPLELHLASVSNFVPELTNDGKAITWKNEHGETALRYSGLVAYDADGKGLEASMKVDQGEIRLTIEDKEAVYPITIDPFIQSAKLTAFTGVAGDEFGHSVSVSGDTAIVGAPQAFYTVGGRKGSAYIFYRNQGGTNNWGEVKRLSINGGVDGDQFGVSVSISGDTAIVGADLKFYAVGGRKGTAYIFYRNRGGTDNWGMVQNLFANDGAPNDHFGHSVSIRGNWAIVGAPGDDDNGANSGSAYIFYRDDGGADNWGSGGPFTHLLPIDGTAGDQFGDDVSISGNWAIVGAYGDDDNGASSGSAYIFRRILDIGGGPGYWLGVKKLTANDGADFDMFGVSVSISGDTAIVGAPGDDDNNSSSGSAYIFFRNQGGTNNWGKVEKLLASDGTFEELFGVSVSISGDTAIVGAYGDDDNGGASGSAYIFSRNQGGTDNWGEVEKLLAGDGAASDYFGYSVSINGDTAIVGAYGDDDNGSESGSAYVYEEVEFIDVPSGHWAEAAIYKIYIAGITKGCSVNPLMYCPDKTVSKAAMAVFLLRSLHGGNYTPPPATGIFTDVNVNEWYAPWVEQLYKEGITKGCSASPLMYCPDRDVSKASMALFLLRAKYGSGYTPPTATGIFTDVPLSHWGADWIEKLYNDGITQGCSASPLMYCPDRAVSRAAMALFIVRTFGL